MLPPKIHPLSDGLEFSRRERLSPEEYRKAVGRFPRVCVDIVFADNEARVVYLPTRIKPVKGPWFLGGSVFAGEQHASAAARKTQEEAGVSLAAERFHLKTYASYQYKDAAGQPTDDLTFTYVVYVSAAEVRGWTVRLEPQEYDIEAGLQPYDCSRIVMEDLPEPVRDIFVLLFPQHAAP